MNTYTVFNQKGGAGKTTTVANLASAFCQRGESVLALDTDPQAHLSLSFLGRTASTGLAEYLSGSEEPDRYLEQYAEGLSVFPASSAMYRLINESAEQYISRLDHLANWARNNFSILLIDCSPNMNWVTAYFLESGSHLLIPVASDYLSLQGLSDLTKTVSGLDRSSCGHVRQTIVLTRFNRRRRLSNEVRVRLEKHFSGCLAPEPVRECVALAEAPSFGQTVLDYRPQSNGSKDYRSLANYLEQGTA